MSLVATSPKAPATPQIVGVAVQAERLGRLVTLYRSVLKLMIVAQLIQLVYSACVIQMPGSNSLRIVGRFGVPAFVGSASVVIFVVSLAFWVPAMRKASGYLYILFCATCAWFASTPEFSVQYSVIFPWLGVLLIATEKMRNGDNP
jgi:hypothetical protein